MPPKPNWKNASKQGVEARKVRAAVKRKIAAKPINALFFLRYGQTEKQNFIAGMRVSELILALPGIGKAKLARIMPALGIAPNKRIGGLGALQYSRLEEFLKNRIAITDVRLPESWGEALNLLTIVAGPTAVGKGTVVSRLRSAHPEVELSISATTRKPRPGEQHGVDYYFVNNATFDSMIKNNQLLEWAVVHGLHRYGTPKLPVQRLLHAGKKVILEIDIQGMRTIREILPNVRTVILLPPTLDALIDRIKRRGTESQEEINIRLATAKEELEDIEEFDHKIVNDDVNLAAQQLWSVMNQDI